MRWLGLLACVVVVVACAGDDTTELPEPDLLVVGPDGIAIERAATATVMAEYRTGTGFAAATDVTWTSSDGAVATIVGDGAQATITAIAPGTTIISAMGRNDLVGVTEVRVTTDVSRLAMPVLRL